MRGFRGRFRRPTPAVAAITLLCLGVYLVFSLTEYNQYLSNGFDLGLFDQAVRSYAHFRAPIAAVKAPGFDLLGDHFSPIVALFAPLYWIWDNPCMLLIAQALLVASSVPIVHRIAARRLPTAPALLMTIVYGLGWPIQSMVNFDVHEVAFAVPMLAAALDAVERRAGRRVLLWSFLLLFVKEDLALVVMAIGVVIAIRGSDERADSSLWNRLRRPPRLAIGLFVMGIVAFVITTKLIIPSLAPDGSFDYWQFDAVGSNFSDAAANIVTEPWHAVAVFFTPFAKSLTLIMLFLPLAAVPLRSPYALITVPLFLERFFNDRVQLWIPQFHYSALPWLVLVVAFVDGAAKLRIFERRVLTRWATTWVIIGQVFTIWAAIEIENSSAPGHGIVQRLADWNDIVVQRSRSAVDFIPADVCVEADNTLLPHLTPRNYATLPGAPNDAPDFVILDLKHPIVGPSQVGPPGADGVRSRVEDRRLLKTGFVVVARFGPIQVYQSPHYTGPSAACGPLGAGKREN
jgi:uncharacterized membrane protein